MNLNIIKALFKIRWAPQNYNFMFKNILRDISVATLLRWDLNYIIMNKTVNVCELPFAQVDPSTGKLVDVPKKLLKEYSQSFVRSYIIKFDLKVK